ncbi:DEAD/DEAH box helicase [Kitasatospora griseola]|uniref:DEAD/DEAH box helicase n=1 Tax=Kitasatospora griseola TaxID=2064 RepID=UPI003430C2A8
MIPSAPDAQPTEFTATPPHILLPPPRARRVPRPPRITVTQLRDYQKRSVTSAVREVKNGGRGIVEMTCGSGKTAVSAECARRLARRGQVLVLLPTIDLLEQTANAWTTRYGRTGLAIAACSRKEALERAEAGGHIEAKVTTNPAELADLVLAEPDDRPVTVYATYASLERLVKAHADFGLPPWDLVVIDEAHHTAGAVDKPWAAVQDDALVPALRRLNFTATLSIAAQPAESDDLSDLVIGKAPKLYSMDDQRIFGRVVSRYTYNQAQAAGWVADYKVLVPVVTDEDLCNLLMLPSVADLRSQRTNEDLQRLALQVALLRAIAALGLRRVITFHSRISAARKFSSTLLETADLLVDRQRLADGDPLADFARPERIWTAAIAGNDRLKHRRETFARFAAHTGETGEECGILCNARLLGEGIDVEAVDAVVFADPKSSEIDIAQDFGRAVRQQPGAGKVAYIIMPVYLPTPDAEADSSEADDLTASDPMDVLDASEAVQAEADLAINATAFRTILAVLRALSSVDSRVVGRITSLRTSNATASRAPAGDDTQPAEQPPGLGDGETEDEEVHSPVEWLLIDAGEHREEILRALKLRAFSPRAQEWLRMYKIAAAFHAEHGHLDVTDKEQYGELITWLDQQRYLKSSGTLDAVRESELNALGMIWSKHANAWERGLAYAIRYRHRHGDLAMPVDHTTDGYSDGKWMGRQRTNADGLTPEQHGRLDDLDPLWRQKPEWNRTCRRYAAYLAAGGTVTGAIKRPGLPHDPDFRPGEWQDRQVRAAKAGKLNPQQLVVLRFLGILPADTTASPMPRTVLALTAAASDPTGTDEPTPRGDAMDTSTAEPLAPSRLPAVTWYATWECHTCGEGGDDQFDDATTVEADHDCDKGDADIAWESRADCETCGWARTVDFEDGDHMDTEHVCAPEK